MRINIPISFLLIVLLTSFNKPSATKFTEVKEGTIINLYDAFGKDTSLTKDFGFTCNK